MSTSPTLISALALEIGQRFTGEHNPAETQLAAAREKARKGNPFSFIALQWPELHLPPQDVPIFARNTAPPDVAERLTESINAAINDPTNPPLRLDWWQKVILAGFCDESIGEIFVKGCTGAGKGASVGIGVNLWFEIFGESRTTLTSETYTHAINNIFGEVILWRHKMEHPCRGKINAEGIYDSRRHYIEVRNPKPSAKGSEGGGEAFSGAHGPNTLYAFDEATASEDKNFDNAEKNARKIIALANPRTIAGRFRAAFDPLPDPNKTGVCYGNIGRRLCVTVGGEDCINVRESRLKKSIAPRGGITINGTAYAEGHRIPPSAYEHVKALIPNQIDTQQFRDILAKPDKRHVDVFAHGRFPQEDPERQVILLSWLARHEAAYHHNLPITCFSLDVARSLDGDNTVFAAGGMEGCRDLHLWKYNDTTFHRDHLLKISREHYGIDLALGHNPVCVDMDGLGAGVGDMLREKGVWVIEFRGNATSAVDPRTYANLRTEAYAVLGRRLNPDDQWRDTTWALPPENQSLRIGLTAPEKMHSADMLRFGIEPKSEIKKKLQGRSPDEADAVVYLFHAVREYHNLNQYFMAAAAPLLAYPFTDPNQRPGDERRPTFDGERENPVAKRDSAGEDLVRWLEGRYAGGGSGGKPQREEPEPPTKIGGVSITW